MKKIFFSTLLCATAGFAMLSCNNGAYDADPKTNNSNVANPIATNNGNGNNGGTSVLTTSLWKIIASTSVIEYPAPIGTQTTDLFAITQDCVKDNTYKFNTDKTVTEDEGATKCAASDPQTTTGGAWDLYDNNTKFSVTEAGNTVIGDVITLNNSSLVLKYVTNINGIKSTTTTSYSRP